jgi:DNA-binding NarL/FixJ family response regulator
MFGVLVVDDHAGFRASVSTVLRQQFPRIGVEEAGDGPEALRVIQRCGTDIVLLDIKLSNGNGLDLTKAIKTDYATVIVVILTGYDLPQYRQAAFRNGADCFLYKGSPSCMQDVVARVEGAILARQETL